MIRSTTTLGHAALALAMPAAAMLTAAMPAAAMLTAAMPAAAMLTAAMPAAAMLTAAADAAPDPMDDATFPAVAPDYPSVSCIQRTMRLLATSTPERRHTVRILFYGQSITRDVWCQQVVRDLETRFPHADLVTANLAIGGFAAQRLVLTAERDLREFYPDLVIFHVYGSHVDYENILRLIRSHTTAEIAIQRDHYGAKAQLATPETKGWHVFMNDRFLPAVAAAYGAALVDVRTPWRQYLLDRGLESQALLRDGVHLNDHGNRLMAALVGQHLVYRADQTGTPAADAWVQTFPVGGALDWHDGVLRLDFTGNRVVALLAADRPAGGPAEVAIDGRRPSAIKETFLFTRANAGPGIDWPWQVSAPFVVTRQTEPVAEEWTITVTEGDRERFAFRVEGAVTGPDGAGSSDRDFVSTSGRLAIRADHWWTQEVGTIKSPIQPGYQWRLRSSPMGVDRLVTPPAPAATGENPVVLASGLAPGHHVLELRAGPGGPPPVRAIVVHRPPLAVPEQAAMPRVSDRVTPEDAGEKR